MRQAVCCAGCVAAAGRRLFLLVRWSRGPSFSPRSYSVLHRSLLQVAEESFTDLFGEDFDRIVPLHNPADVDGVMTKWWNERAKLDRLRYQQQRLTSEQAELKAAEAEHQRELKQQIAALEQQIGQLEAEDGQQQPVAAAGRLPAHQQIDIEQPAATGLEQPRQQPEAGNAKPTGWKAVVCCGGGRTASSRAASMPPAKRQKRLKLVATQLDKVTTQIEVTEERLATLQSDFEEAQLVAAEALPAPCFFATFHTAQAAAQAARLNLNPLHERMMRWVDVAGGLEVSECCVQRACVAALADVQLVCGCQLGSEREVGAWLLK